MLLLAQTAPASPSFLSNLDTLLFAVFPYVAMAMFFLITISRYRSHPFTYSSLSTQFIENRQHFWGLVPFHYGVIAVLTGHVVAFAIPRSVLLWNARPLRLYILEVSALIFAVLTLVGLIQSIHRRLTSSKVRTATTPTDWIVLAMLLFQLGSGMYIAVMHRWGSSWFATSVSPYLWSLVRLNPDISTIVPMPAAVKLHIISAFLLIAFFPFTRLVHVLVVPNMYLWRQAQVVRWYRDRRVRSSQ